LDSLAQVSTTTRSILDAFTIFPFAIVLAMALGEAFKTAVTEKDFIDWKKLPALISFLLLILPFYQGMNRYLLHLYGPLTQLPDPDVGYLLFDGIAFMLEAALFFVLSRTLKVEHWRRFYGTVCALLFVDSLWGVSAILHNVGDATLIRRWIFLNFATVALLPAALLPGAPDKHALRAGIGVAIMLGRTAIDYMISWNFYFKQ
jgi:hypothetical protein